MNSFSKNIRFCLYAIIFATFCLSGSVVLAQDKDKDKMKDKSKNKTTYEFCSKDNNSWNDNASFKELREMTLPSTSLLNVDGGQNGGIRVKGSDRSDILVRACVQAWGKTEEEAKANATGIRVETAPNVHAVGATDKTNWGVSYEILVPRSTNLKLATHNGGISINAVEGSIDFSAMNGGINLSEVAGTVKGRTMNGGVNVTLSGNSWKGSGLDVETTNGGVNITMPENYAAKVETGTVNGGFRSNINGLNVEKTDGNRWNRNSRVNTSINGGGAPIRIITTNGGVSINSAK